MRKAKQNLLLDEDVEMMVNKMITFQNHDGEIDQSLPDPILLKIHAALAQVVEASAAEPYVLKLLQDRENTLVRAADGSTDLNSILMSCGLLEAFV